MQKIISSLDHVWTWGSKDWYDSYEQKYRINNCQKQNENVSGIIFISRIKFEINGSKGKKFHYIRI